MQSGIYAIMNIVNGKQYVGSAVNIPGRWRVHRHHLRARTHTNRYLQHAWNKHGEAAFTFTILEECPREQLIEREQHWIDTLNTVHSGYNRVPQAGSHLGLRLTPEQCAKFAERQRRLWQDPAYRANFIAQVQAVYTTNPARRTQVADQVRQYWQDPAYRDNWQQKMRAWQADPQNRARMGDITRRRWADPAARSRMIAAQNVGKADPTHRRRLSERARALWADPAYREKVLQARREGRARRQQQAD